MTRDYEMAFFNRQEAIFGIDKLREKPGGCRQGRLRLPPLLPGRRDRPSDRRLAAPRSSRATATGPSCAIAGAPPAVPADGPGSNARDPDGPPVAPDARSRRCRSSSLRPSPSPDQRVVVGLAGRLVHGVGERARIPSGQWTSRLPGLIGAIEDPAVELAAVRDEADRIAVGERERARRLRALTRTSWRTAPVRGSTSRWTMELNCLPRRVETRKRLVALRPLGQGHRRRSAPSRPASRSGRRRRGAGRPTGRVAGASRVSIPA